MRNETHAFIVRVWYEARDSTGNIVAWRGSIDHVGADERLYFQDLQGVVTFIQEQTGINNKQPPTGWQSSIKRIQDELKKFRSKLNFYRG